MNRVSIMGILNVTPDSFSDGGCFLETGPAVEQALRMIEEGANIIDIGGESTRPNAEPVPAEEELRRVLPVIEAVSKYPPVRISVDTYKPEVARECLLRGASMVNDVSGLHDPAMIETVRSAGAGVVVMHMRGTPKTMQQQTEYGDVVKEVKTYLWERAAAAQAVGVQEIIIDPGIGFSKTAQHNFEILRRLHEFREAGYPVLIGPSRKSFLGTLPSSGNIENRLEAGLAAITIAAMNGASIVRVHDVKQTKRALEVVEAVKAA